MGALLLLLFWFGGAFIVANIAKGKGKSFGIWFFISLLLDPIIAGLILSQL
jgi:hypothetical protein